tara:strand:- start:87 stop:248 length:162 start_codon:yes stop_codon:yes gene_type:complete
MNIILYITLGVGIVNFFLLCFIALEMWGIGEGLAEYIQKNTAKETKETEEEIK